MPSGLTSDIYEGKDVTLREYALRCATQVGGGYQASNYGEGRLPLDKAPVMECSGRIEINLEHEREELVRWQRLKQNPDELRREYDAWCTKVELENIGRDKHYDGVHRRYDDMLAKVQAWHVTEPYKGLKDLMVRQLKESIEFDCIEKEHRHYENIIPMEEWIDVRIECCQRAISFYTEKLENERKRIAENNEWLQGLYRLLDDVSPYGDKETKEQ